MKLIDINCAIGLPLKASRFSTAEGLLQWMDRYQIGQAVTYHSEALRDPEEANGRMARLCADSSGRLLLCAVLDPALEGLGLPGTGSALRRLKALRPAAARIFPNDHRYPFSTFYAGNILEACQALRLPLILSVEYKDDFFLQLPGICADYPQVPFILPRFGLRGCRSLFPLLEKLPNVYLDMAVMVDTGMIEEICQRFGSHRLLFGSGMPTHEPSGSLGLLRYAQLSREDRENIAGRNFESLLGQIRW